MSEPTVPSYPSRPPVVPIVLGLLLVTLVIAVALVIERSTDDDLDLPDTLAGDFRADSRNEAVASAEERLEDALNAPVTVRSYLAEDSERQVTLTVVDDAAGPFAPSGPQADPEALGLARGPSELVREGDVVCQVAWGAVVPEGDQVPEEEPVGVFCQLGADGRTYWLNGRGVSVDDAVEILDDIID